MTHTLRWRFGPFDADAAEHQLKRDGTVVPVTRKAFALLAALLRRPGRLVTKSELFETVWAGTVVTDAALSRVIRELRVALGDDASAPRYIATAHGLGFRFVALVAMEGDATTTPAATPALPDRPLAGRDPELDFLEQALAETCAGQRRVVFIAGEAGIGKTTLVETFLSRRPLRSDVWAAQGRCIEQYGVGEAYLPILEALESLARQVGSDEMRDLLGRYAPAWLAQLPWLSHDADPATAASLGGDVTAQRMLREIAQALEVLAARRPIALWLEDLHWSDPSTLAVVSFLAGRREPARLLLIATFRPGDAHAAETPLPGLVAQLRRHGHADELSLGLLDVDAVEAYLSARFGGDRSDALRELGAFIRRRTDGNALFMVTLVDDLVRRGLLQPSADGCHLTTPLTRLDDFLPDSLRLLVHGEIDRLSDDDRSLVEAAAVAGVDFSAAEVAAVLATDIATIEDRCTRFADQGRLLRRRAATAWPDGTVAAGFGFLHALYHQGAYERVPEGRRADWQRRIGLAQEEAHGVQCGEIAAELAMRFEIARDFERSLRYLEMAGANALACGAYLECVDLIRHALELLPHVPAAGRPRRELDLLLPLGAASMAAQGYASKGVESTYQRALVLCRECGRPGELVRVLRGLWNVVFLQADLARAQEAAEELLAMASDVEGASLAFDAHTKLGQTCMHRGDMAGARRHLEHALALPETEDDSVRRREAPRAIAYLAWVLWYTGHPDQALARGDEALRLSRLAKSPHSRAFALGFVSWLHVFCGDIARALELAVEQRALSLEHGLVYWRTWADFTHGLAAVRTGRSQDTAIMSAAIEEMRSTGAEVGIVHFLCLLADAELDVLGPVRARETLAVAEALLAKNGNGQHAAEVERLLGRAAFAEGPDPRSRAEAERRFTSASSIARAQGAWALELRAATELARLRADGAQAESAAAALAAVYAAFGEGLATADLVAARALLSRP